MIEWRGSWMFGVDTTGLLHCFILLLLNLLPSPLKFTISMRPVWEECCSLPYLLSKRSPLKIQYVVLTANSPALPIHKIQGMEILHSIYYDLPRQMKSRRWDQVSHTALQYELECLFIHSPPQYCFLFFSDAALVIGTSQSIGNGDRSIITQLNAFLELPFSKS